MDLLNLERIISMLFPICGFGLESLRRIFLKSNDVISNLKIRASVGVTGNQEIGDYAFAQNMGTSNIILDNNYKTGLYRNSFGNPDLKWEKLYRQMRDLICPYLIIA